MDPRIISDNPVRTLNDDLWGLRDVANELARLIASIEDPPLTVGVFGSWGAGKTSLLSLLKETLENADVARLAWFDAWRYRERQEIWPGLLQCILAALADHTPAPGVASRLIDFGRAASRVFVARGAQVLSHGLVSAEDVEAILDRYAELQDRRTSKLAGFAEEFDALTGEALAGGRLVVLVDDLDRCDPEASLEILEGIKLFLGSRHCIFVVALDANAFSDALRTRYPDNEEYRVNYLERHIQLVRYIPDPPDDRLRCGLASLSRLDLPDGAWNLVRVAAEGNPRRAKRFINMLLLTGDWSLDDRPQLLTLGRLMVFRVQFPKFFTALTRDPSLWQDLEAYQADKDSMDQRRAEHLARFLDDYRLASFLRDTGPEAVSYYPPAPGPESLPALLQQAWRYGPAMGPRDARGGAS